MAASGALPAGAGLWTLADALTQFAARHALIGLLPPAILWLITLGITAGVAVCLMMLWVMVGAYAERKLCAHIQDRLGPMRVGWHGILQSLVDGVKLLLKEDIIPAKADAFLFGLAPCLVFGACFSSFVVMPFSSQMIVADLNVGVLYLVALGSAVLVGVVMAGWASNNKWALFGAMRTVAMVVSYEIPAGLSIVPIVMLTGSLSTQDIVRAQDGGMLNWFLFAKFPFLFCAFIVLFTSALAECNRTPFDLAEAESELVAGYHTEYSGIRFSFFMAAEFTDMLIVSMLTTILFLGGWQTPNFEHWFDRIAVLVMVGLVLGYFVYLWRCYLDMGERLLMVVSMATVGASLAMFALNAQFAWFMLKAVTQVFVMIWLRWTLPRPRIDQLMYLCWKVLVPIAFVNFVCVGIWYVLV